MSDIFYTFPFKKEIKYKKTSKNIAKNQEYKYNLSFQNITSSLILVSSLKEILWKKLDLS